MKNRVFVLGASLLLALQSLATTLTHRYPFIANASDVVGGANGQLVGGATISGGAVVLDGVSGYVNLPNNLVTGYTSVTIELWVTDTGSGNWARIFDFGNSTGGEDFPLGSGTSGIQYFFVTPRSGSGTLWGNYSTPSTTQGAEWPGTALPTGVRQHLVWASDGTAQMGWIYVNGVLVASNTSMTLTPAAIGNTVNDWIGRSQFNDPLFKGSLSDFRIYNGAISPLQIAVDLAAGPGKLITDPGVLQSINFTVTTPMAQGASRTAGVIGNFVNLTNVNLLLTAGVNFSSSNPNVVTINSAGLITAVGTGAATVTASYAGLTAAQTIYVSDPPQTLAHRYSFTSNANDSEGTAHGTLAGGAVISGNTVFLNGADAFVDLPNNLFTNLNSLSFEAWFTDNGGNGWARLWDFGNSVGGEGNQGGGTSYMLLSVPSGFAGVRGSYNLGSGEQGIDLGARPAVGVEHHVVWTQDANAQTAKIYLDGALLGENDNFTFTPAGIGATVNDWLGRSQYNDPYFYGSIDEFRIYAAALSAQQVTQDFQLGPNVSPQTGPVTITMQPTNLIVMESQPASFSVGYLGRHPVTFQWYRHGTPVVGATNSTYQLPSALITDNGAGFSVALTNSVTNVFFSAFSSNAILTVLPDTNLPVVTRIFNLGTTNAQIVFSKLLAAASATNTANYAFTNGLPVTGALLNPDNLTVVLTTAAMAYGSNYSIVINGVRDRAASPNTIATNTTASFQALPYAPQDLGSPTLSSTLTSAGNGFDVTAAGGDFGGVSDQGNFSYQVFTGNFDVSVRLAGLSLSDIFAKAGLMARENLSVSSRFAAALATPAMNGSFFEWRDPTGNASSTGGNFPANYPNTWLRLNRVGNTFTGLASYDGQTWTTLGSATISMASQIYLGLSVSSHSTNTFTTAQFRDLASVTNALIAAVINPHDAMGPSSRTTPIAFSEIMYKPAPRTDGKNLEFVEIYNSNPWFQDISGYQIACADISYMFPPGTTIPGGGYVVIAAAPTDIQSVYGIANVMGPYAGSLKKTETLQLLDERTNVLLTVPYSNVYPWPVAADGTGHSLTLANPTYGEGDPRAWAISDVMGGSPGQMDGFTPSPLRNVVINEFLAHTDPPDYDYVELYNHSTSAVDISGCILTDDPATNKFVIPPGTVIPARGFFSYSDTNMDFSLNAAGESVYFKNPGQTRILDAVQFGAQENGVASGRWPDGANDFYRLSAKTPGGSNAPILLSAIVINELMYDSISGNDDDQFIELYNKGTNTINLAGWQFTSGVTFTFPSVTMAPNGYLVVARNATNLFAKYPNLNNGNTVGNYSGKLSHSGEYLALTMPAEHKTTDGNGNIVTNIINIVVNDLTYGTGGRWGEWSAGGGSSLELVDPNSNNRLAANWADSDETQKSVWTNIETTAVLDNGANYDATIDYAQIGLLDAGECLVDNIEVNANGTNYVANSNFESGTNGWTFQGDQVRSSLENTGYLSSHSLHIRCSDRMWTGANSCEMALNSNTLAAGQTATLRFKARWLHGWPEPLLRLNGNWLEATAAIPVPVNLGTPGMANSRYVTNAGPAIYTVTHNPPLPAAGQAAVVTVQVQDPNGVNNPTLYYRLDPATAYTAVMMKDDGTGGDAVAGDGIFSATIPGQAANQVVAFYVSATDRLGTTTRFPAVRPGDNEPVRECLVMFGDGNPGGSFGVYHLWLTQASINRWASLSDLSNEANDGTVVCGHRVIYNMQGRFAGSPYHQGFDTPTGNLCHYKWIFNEDDKLLGATSFNKIHQPGNGAGDDASIQREQLANTFLRALGVPWLNRRHVAVYVNGHRRGTLMEDAQTPDGDVVKEHFPNDPDGFLYKMQPWFEFGPFPSGNAIPFNNNGFCALNSYTTTGGAKKPARYRYNFEIRRTPDSASDFTDVYSLVDAANAGSSPNFVANLENLADMENWMRVFAANHAAGNWDSFGAPNGQNLYGYIGTQGTRYSLLMFDFNISLGNSGSWGPGLNLFAYNGADQGLANIYNNPTFLRMYWRALQALVNGPLNVANSAPLITAKYNAFTANGLHVENPAANIEPWLSQAQSSIAAQLTAANAASFTLSAGSYAAANNVITLAGNAPFEVTSISINGESFAPTWNSVTGWMVRLPAPFGTNIWTVVAHDRNGNVVSGTNAVTVDNSSVPASPFGNLVFNEIMFTPPLIGAEYVELFNRSTNTTFDLSGWQVNGLDYTFPAGATIAPTNYLVLTANGVTYAAAYGAVTPMLDEFSGKLQTDGETLSLVQPGVTNLVVDRVRYETNAPWPGAANNSGTSLQLTDPAQDNSRAGNWNAGQSNPVVIPRWVYVWTNLTATSSRLYIYLQSAGDIYVDDFKLVSGLVPESGNNFVTNGDFELPPGNNWNLTANFVSSAVSSSAKHRGTNALHVVASAAGSGSGNAIYQDLSPTLTTGANYTLSFWYLQTTNGGPLVSRLSSAAIFPTFNPAPPAAVTAAAATPGVANSVATRLPTFPTLWLNEVQAENLTGPLDNVGEREPWLELYNYGSNTVSLAGLYLGTNYLSPTAWTFPPTSSIAPGQFLVVWADGQPQPSTGAVLHTSFRLAPTAGSVVLSRFVTNALQVVDYLNYSALPANFSYGDVPDGQPCYRQLMYRPTPGGTNNGAQPPITVAINEWMAGNTHTIQDPLDSNKYDDWFELYNYGTNTVNLAGYYLTHSLTNQTEFLIPSGYTIPAHGYLLVWADKKSPTGAIDLHVNFKLSKSGASIGLYDTAGNAMDYVTFGPQVSDISEGRYPNGAANIHTLPVATPGTNNPAPNTPPVVVSPGDQTLYLGQTLSFALQANDADLPAQSLAYSLDSGAPTNAAINPLSGLFVWTPTADQSPSTNQITVRVTDNGVPPLTATQTFTIIVANPPTGSSVGINGNTLTLSWPTVPGKTYRIQFKKDLNNPIWSTLGADQSGTGLPLILNVDYTTNQQRYYRVQVVE